MFKAVSSVRGYMGELANDIVGQLSLIEAAE
jgi:hypothetical protein